MPPRFIDDGKVVEHPLELKFNAPAWDILSAIEQGARSQEHVKGKLAEWFLFKQLEDLKARGIRSEDVVRRLRTSRLGRRSEGTYVPDGVQEHTEREDPEEVRRELPGRDSEDSESTRRGQEATGLSGRRVRDPRGMPV